jgi:hypothetical protein
MSPALFTDHPASVGETYGQHLHSASSFGIRMILAGFACMLHGFLPFLFVRTGRKTIELLHDRMVVNRHRQPLTVPSSLGSATNPAL